MISTLRQLLREKATSTIFLAYPQDSVTNASKVMTEHNIGALLVISESNRVLGIISERDCVRGVLSRGVNPSTTPVSEVMTKHVVHMHPDDRVDECMAVMTEFRLRHIPVIEHGALIGLISIGDVVKAVISDRNFLIDELTSYVAGTRVTHGASSPKTLAAA